MSAEQVNLSDPIAPAEGCAFYTVALEILTEDEASGKVKKAKEEHLVEGHDCTEVEEKVRKEMAGTMGDWKITNLKVSKILCVY